jgi:hypothetical protein
MREYRPAGYLARSAWLRFRLRTSLGYRGWARRIWLCNDPHDPNGVLLVDCLVEEMHCRKDVELSMASVLRSSEATTALAKYGMDLLDRPSQSQSTIEWQYPELTFRSLWFDHGPYHCEVMEVSRSKSSSWQAESIADAVRSRIRANGPTGSRFCIYSLWRTVWGLADIWPLIVAIFAINAILAALLPGLVALLIFVLSLVLIIWAGTSWSSRLHYRERLKANAKIAAQGDEDGTVRRALASIGVELPAPGN